jgi:hypothetical protein
MEHDDIFEEPYLDDEVPGYVPDGDRFDRPVPSRRVQKIVRSIAALVLASMLAAAGTPISWVSIATAILMLLIWAEIWSPRTNDKDDVI